MKRYRLVRLGSLIILFFALLLLERHPSVILAQDPGSPTITPTPLPITIISHPGAGDAVAGYATIRGSTLTSNCAKYSLDISPAGRESWQNLVITYGCVANGDLYILNTKAYKDGYYDLRLRAIRFDGNYEEAFLRWIEIRNSFPPTATPAFDALGTPLPTLTPTEFPQPTATLGPSIIHQIPGGQGFYKPEIGETVHGYVDIVGSVYGFPGQEFLRYELYISPNGQQQWTWLYSSTAQVWQAPIYVLDSTRFPDGYYDLLLRNVYRDSNYDEFILRYVKIANGSQVTPGKQLPVAVQQSGISAPKSNSVVQGIVEVRGTVVDANFSRWELYWSPAGKEQWTFLISNTRSVPSGVLAKLDLSNLGGSMIDLRLRVVRQNANYDEYFVRGVSILASPPTATATIGAAATISGTVGQ